MTSRLADYADWHALQVETGDLDPVYPVYRNLSERRGLSQGEVAWLCVLHVAYYNVTSALTAFELAPEPGEIPEDPPPESTLLRLSCATERRGHRDPRKLSAHLVGLRRELGDDVLGWLGAYGWEWEPLNRRITELVGNGRWASYKLAEMLGKVVGVAGEATDAGHRYSSGPRKGLADLFPGLPTGNGPDDIAELDALTAELGVLLDEPDVAQVETSLCDFHSLVKGGYYLGHDIDAMLGQTFDTRVWPDVSEARREVFDVELLGEVGERWTGVRTELKTAYRDRGTLDVRRIS